MADVLIVGSGGREQALAWKIEQSEEVAKVYVAPGNAGSSGNIQSIPIQFDDVDGLLNFAQEKNISLTVIGQEIASEVGVVDAFEEAGLTIFGPNKAAAKIETSKAFSKDLMEEQKIPTAQYKNFTDVEAARSYAISRPLPIVIKADGLATGKGVIIAYEKKQIDKALDQIMVKKIFGNSGDTVVVEDFLKGQEVSLHALCDGKTSVIFPAAQDHKPIFDGDRGPNTGGMGVIAPIDWVKPEILNTVNKMVVQPALQGLIDHSSAFKGCLYPGLMIDQGVINVLEFNARFGDPETEVYMRLLDGDLYKILKACAEGALTSDMVSWIPGYAATVILASEGYPGSYTKNIPIHGLETASNREDIVIFHAGTAIKDGEIVTSGGRVLNVTATGESLEIALQKVYDAIADIHFDGMQYRKDIGKR